MMISFSFQLEEKDLSNSLMNISKVLNNHVEHKDSIPNNHFPNHIQRSRTNSSVDKDGYIPPRRRASTMWERLAEKDEIENERDRLLKCVLTNSPRHTLDRSVSTENDEKSYLLKKKRLKKQPPCSCGSSDVRKEIEELHESMARLESSLKQDMRNILELLKGKSSECLSERTSVQGADDVIIDDIDLDEDC